VLNVLTDDRPNKGIVDYGVIVDSGAAVTLTNLEVVDSRRIVENSTRVVEPPVIIQGVGGKPVKCTSSCSMYMYSTDSDGERHKFILDNCYICNAIRTPLVSATHLVSKGCVIRLANTGHSITFPDHTESQLETLTSGLIALLPKPSAEMRTRPKINNEMRGVNQIIVTTIDSRDNYEVEVGVDDNMPDLVTDTESEDSDGETFIPKEGNRTQNTGREVNATRDVSSVKLPVDQSSSEHHVGLGRISQGPLQRLAVARKVRRDGRLHSLMCGLREAIRTNFNARLKADLRWIWDKLQGKPSGEQQVVDSLREQFRMIASLELELEPQQVKGNDQGEKDDELTNDEYEPKSVESRLAWSKELHAERKWMSKMKQAIDDAIG
jgi:hypothetical protein